MMKFLLYLVFFSFQLCALDFSTPKVSYQAKINETSYTANFSFTNNTSSDVTIEKLTPSCNCIVPDLIKKTYKPGEQGSLALKFNFQRRLGLQQNRLLVYLRGQKKPMTLVLEVDIPRPYTYSKRFLAWKGDGRSKKSISLDLHKDFKASVTLQETDKELPLKITLDKIHDQKYEISAVPQTGIKKGRYKVNLKILQADKPARVSTIYFIIN